MNNTSQRETQAAHGKSRDPSGAICPIHASGTRDALEGDVPRPHTTEHYHSHDEEGMVISGGAGWEDRPARKRKGGGE